MVTKRMVLTCAVAACVAAAMITQVLVSERSRSGGVSEVERRATDTASLELESPVRLVTHTVQSGSLTRVYMAYVPECIDGGQTVPVVLDIHGTGSNPAQELSIDGLAVAAEEHGFIVLLPEAVVPHPSGGATWNVPADPRSPNDVRFLLDLLDDAFERYRLDASRVYVAGFSGGARLGSDFASRHADRVAALAAVGGLRAPALGSLPIPVIAFHGTGDPINPYAGGGPSYWGYGVERALKGWVERNRIDEEDVEAIPAPSVWMRTWWRSDGAADVILYRFDGGHVWPGSSFPFPIERFGLMLRGIDATKLIVEFFGRYGLTAASPRATLGH